MKPGRKLGEILTDKKIISEEQLNLALEEQKTTGEFLGRVLVTHGWMNETDLLEALSEQFNIAFIHLDNSQINWEAALQYSYALLHEHCCIPINQDHVSVTVAICDPLDAWVMSEIESQARGRTVELALALKSEIKNALEELTRRSVGRH